MNTFVNGSRNDVAITPFNIAGYSYSERCDECELSTATDHARFYARPKPKHQQKI